MKSCRTSIAWSIATVFILAIPGVSLAGYDYIDITQPYLKKLPIAVPFFKKISTGDMPTGCRKHYLICLLIHLILQDILKF